MAKNTSLEDGLSRLLKLAPNITLTPREIQLIIDGKMNQVISEYKLNPCGESCSTFTITDTSSGTTTVTTTPQITINTDNTSDFTVKVEDYTTIDTSSEKSFDEYFK